MVITNAFPPPPASVIRILELLAVQGRGDAAQIAQAGDLTDLPRPWNPVTCPNDLREDVWAWCDQVAAWLNSQYAWRPAQMIPPCWPRHPHIARELAVLAFLRWNVEQASSPIPTEEWHRYDYPMFCDRMFNRLGESGCRTGAHVDWPARGRHAAYTAGAATDDRHHTIYTDTHQPTPLHATRRA